MSSNPDFNQIFDRIANGEETERDMQTLRQLLNARQGQNSIQIGKYHVNITEGRDIQIGDRIYQGADAEAIKEVLRLVLQEKRKADVRKNQNRLALLNKVKKFWIEGVLEKSLHQRAIIPLEIETNTEAINLPWNIRFETNNGSSTSVINLFEELGKGRTLLILGTPGSGKTITLLQLTQSLIEYAENDPEHLIPVVFNLSSWKGNRQEISSWIVEELNEKYQIPTRVGWDWVKKQKLLLLLDGLDEVRETSRNDCIVAINTFYRQYSTEIILCSRLQDYEVLQSRLELGSAVSAILIQPLTNEQIHQYLNRLNIDLSGLRTLVTQDTNLRRLAKSPLMLNLMVVAYSGYTVENFPRANTLFERQDQLFNSYIDRMFERSRIVSYTGCERNTKSQYERSEATRWLIWLAQQMILQSQSIFLIEKMQPAYLLAQSEKLKYRLITYSSTALISGLISGLIASMKGFNIGLYAAICGVILGVLICRSSQEIKLAEKMNWYLSIGNAKEELEEKEGISWSFNIVFLEIVIGVGSPKELELRTSPNQGIWTSAKNSIIYLFIGIISVYLVAFAFLFMSLFSDITSIAQSVWIYCSIASAFLLWLISRSNAQFAQRLVEKLRHLLPIVIAVGVIAVILFVLVNTLIIFIPVVQKLLRSEPSELINSLNQLKNNWVDWLTNGVFVFFASVSGVYFWLKYGGLTTIQHLALRFVLSIKDRIPRNYAHFLNWASDRILLQQVGGGYIFIHRLLMEHFAQFPR